MSATVEIFAGIIEAVAAVKDTVQRVRLERELQQVNKQYIELHNLLEKVIEDSKEKSVQIEELLARIYKLKERFTR